jgi:dihydrofolate synthase / folylpolyglutamate synthase
MQILGNTLTEIATEKAGIIKPHGLVVTSVQTVEALLAIAAAVERQQARLIRVGPADIDLAQEEVEAGRLLSLSYRYRLEERSREGQRFTIWTPKRAYTGLEIPLAGQHQLENATAALATLEMLRERGVGWDEEALRVGMAAVRWPARMEVVGQHPTIVVDGAHNADSMQKLMRALRESFSWRRLIVVLSVNADKDLVGIVQALADVDVVVLTRMMNPRAASIEQMQELFAQYAPHVQVYTARDTNAAMNLALESAPDNDLICATGSLYLAAEALRWAAANGDKTAAATIESVDH